VPELPEITAERGRRLAMWREIAPARKQAPPRLRELGIYGGAQGIWVDKVRTSALPGQPSGVTVSLLHTGSSYPDDLSETGLLYHYPLTRRQPGRDSAEVEATKAAAALQLPVFIITYPSIKAATRDVRLGWIEDWSDEARIFLVVFGDEPPSAPAEQESDEEPFQAVGERSSIRRQVLVRAGQQRFKLRVLKRYGARCGVCAIAVPELLEAAHVRPYRLEGSHHPANGLVLCASHHRAFDADLFAIRPDSLDLEYRPAGPRAEALAIGVSRLALLRSTPHMDAIRWHYDAWRQSVFGGSAT